MVGINEEDLSFIRFLDAASREMYRDHRNNKFCCDRGFFYALLMGFRWAPLKESPPASRSPWMRDLYAILPIVGWDDPHLTIRIRGVDIPLNASLFNDALEVPMVPNMVYEDKLKEMVLG